MFKRRAQFNGGFTLIELMVTLTILTILTLGVIPLVKVTVKRQKEQRLRETLREMRIAIDQFHHEAVYSQCRSGNATAAGGNALGGNVTGGVTQPGTQNTNQQNTQTVDPRVKVVIADCKIFGVDNPDGYPPDLETLVNGVEVRPLGGGGIVPGQSVFDQRATEANGAASATKRKVYLRSVPVDPMTGESDWDLRSNYDTADSGGWGGQNVFDVRSKSNEEALDGTKYSDW